MKPVSWVFTLDFRSIVVSPSKLSPLIASYKRVLIYAHRRAYMYRIQWNTRVHNSCVAVWPAQLCSDVFVCVSHCLFLNRQRWHLVDNGTRSWQLIALQQFITWSSSSWCLPLQIVFDFDSFPIYQQFYSLFLLGNIEMCGFDCG